MSEIKNAIKKNAPCLVKIYSRLRRFARSNRFVYFAILYHAIADLEKSREIILVETEDGFPDAIKKKRKSSHIDDFLCNQKLLGEAIQKKEIVFLEWSNHIWHDVSLLLEAGIGREQISFYENFKVSVNDPADCYDIGLGYVIDNDYQIPGFQTYGDLETADHRILILGNSTSYTDFCHMKSWPEFLWEKLKNTEGGYSLLCGGMTNFNSFQELLKLERDGIYLKPDLVISLSGVCNVWENYKNKLEPQNMYLWKYQKNIVENAIKRGLANELDHIKVKTLTTGLNHTIGYEEWWIDTMRMIHAISKEYDADFIGYLQPNLYVGEYQRDGFERGKNDTEYVAGIRRWYDKVKILLRSYPYLRDITDIFDGEENIYWDSCHLYEKGNAIIAQKIFEDIRVMLDEKAKIGSE